MKLFNHFISKKLTLVLVFVFLSLESWAQKNPGIPRPRGPVDLSDPVNLVIFIVIPIVILILYFVWRSEMKKRRQREEDQRNSGK